MKVVAFTCAFIMSFYHVDFFFFLNPKLDFLGD